MQETRRLLVWSLGWEGPLEKEMATHSSILAWEVPWIEEPGGLQSMGLQRARYSLATKPQQQRGSQDPWSGNWGSASQVARPTKQAKISQQEWTKDTHGKMNDSQKHCRGFPSGSAVGNLLRLGGDHVQFLVRGRSQLPQSSEAPLPQWVKPAHLERRLWDEEEPSAPDRSPVGGDGDPVQPEVSE